jgi:nuclear transport factor 2 (NTF2) superfamily protein
MQEKVVSAQPKSSLRLVPPFTLATAILKVRAIEDDWNSHDPERVARGYSTDCCWRGRSEFLHGRAEAIVFLTRKWSEELEYRLIKEMWAFSVNRIAVRFICESHDKSGQWHRAYGNENWEFDAAGLSRIRHASINELAIREEDRFFRWPLGCRPDNHPGLTALGL